MYEVIKRTGRNFMESPTSAKLLGAFPTFDEAHAFAVKNVCQDLYHEPRYGADNYWFSNEGNKDTAYKVYIRKKKEGM